MAETKPLRPNLVSLAPHVYLLRSQAGFRKALREQRDSDDSADNHDAYPTFYPCVVTFRHYYNGGGYRISVGVVSVREYRERLTRMLGKLVDD